MPLQYAFKTVEYPLFFFISALDITAKFATRLGFPADAARYSGLSSASRAFYLANYYDASSNCFAECTYVSQIFGLTLGIAPEADSDKIWAHAMGERGYCVGRGN